MEGFRLPLRGEGDDLVLIHEWVLAEVEDFADDEVLEVPQPASAHGRDPRPWRG